MLIDQDYFRDILLEFSRQEYVDIIPKKVTDIYSSDYTLEQMEMGEKYVYHIDRLAESGYIQTRVARDISHFYRLYQCPIITKQGNEYIQAISDENIWTKTKERIKGMSNISLELVKEIAISEAKKTLGLL